MNGVDGLFNSSLVGIGRLSKAILDTIDPTNEKRITNGLAELNTKENRTFNPLEVQLSMMNTNYELFNRTQVQQTNANKAHL